MNTTSHQHDWKPLPAETTADAVVREYCLDADCKAVRTFQEPRDASGSGRYVMLSEIK